MACSHCLAIPAELFGDADYQHIQHPTRSALRASAQAGCHICSLFCTHLDWATYMKGSAAVSNDKQDQEGPVILQRTRLFSVGPPLTIKCGSDVGIVACKTNQGFLSGLQDALEYNLFSRLTPFRRSG